MNKTVKIIIVLVSIGVGFFIGMEYKAYQIRSVIQDAVGEVSNAFGNVNPSEDQIAGASNENITYIEKTFGEEISLETIKFRVNSSTEKSILSDSFGSPSVAKEDAKFVVVDLSITNTTNAPFTFSPDDGIGIRLIDEKDRLFHTYGDTIGSVEDYLNVRELSPGIAETGVLVYEIPKDSTSYSFAVGKDSVREIYFIKLK